MNPLNLESQHGETQQDRATAFELLPAPRSCLLDCVSLTVARLVLICPLDRESTAASLVAQSANPI